MRKNSLAVGWFKVYLSNALFLFVTTQISHLFLLFDPKKKKKEKDSKEKKKGKGVGERD